MLWAALGGLIGSFFGVILGQFATRFMASRLQSVETGPIIKAMAAPGKSRGKRVPTANSDLKAYHKEIQEQGENRV